jgi:hypothetical protein
MNSFLRFLTQYPIFWVTALNFVKSDSFRQFLYSLMQYPIRWVTALKNVKALW